jgi:eukaryotic-like serine/threonine-protein kinase
MSPEQARGEDIDGRSDIFSMGGVFYFMLTGRKPFAATALPTLFHQIQSEEPAAIEGSVPPELVTIVMKALSKNRETRYQSCEEVLADLRLVKHLYPVEAVDTAALHVTADAPAASGPLVASPDGSTPGMATAGEREAASTDDTTDFDPRAQGTDDTVSLEPPTWRARFKAGIDAAIAGMSGRLTGTSTPAATRETSTRKR